MEAETVRAESEIRDLLVKQVGNEANAAQLYEALGQVARAGAWFGCEKLFQHEADEELQHRRKVNAFLVDYWGYRYNEPAVASQTLVLALKPAEWMSQAKAAELENLDQWKAIAGKALEEECYDAFGFAQWFIKQQVKTITMYSDIQRRLDVAGNDRAALLAVDTEIGGMA